MASLSKIANQYRVRYRLHLPDGSTVDRSRRVERAGQAKELKAQADIMEALVRRQEYGQGDIDRWIRERLLTRGDAERLHGYRGGNKTLERAAEEYRRTWAEVGAGEQVSREGRVKNILSVLGGDTLINSLRYSHGELLKSGLRERGLKAVTVNKHLQDLKRIINLQVAERALDYNPFATTKGLRVPAEEKITHVVPSQEEIREILAQAEKRDQGWRPLLGGQLTLFLLMFFGCGLRRSEAMAARVENIDWQSRGLLLTETKTGKPRTVGLGRRLYELLLPRKGEPGHILPRFAPWSVSRAIRQHFADCGLKMRLHDTRHTYTTLLQEQGATPLTTMGRTGHSDMRMLSHYSHPKLSQIHEDDFSFMDPENTAR